MSPKSHRSRINRIAVITASLAFATAAMATPTVASAHTSTAHSATVAHHKTVAHHPAKSTPTKASKTHKARSATVVHHKKPTPVKHTIAASPPSSQPSPVAAAANCVNADVIPTTANLDLVRAATLCLINQQRALAGLAALSENPALDAAAQAHSDDMVSGNYFDHVAPNGADPLSRVVAAGFATVADVLDLGENIAAGGGSLATPEQTVTNWMASPPHRANILDPTFKETGIGITPAVPQMLGIGDSGATYTQAFGTTG